MAWISTPGSSRARIWLACRPWVRNPPDRAVPDDERDDGMSRGAGCVVGVDGGRHRLVQARHLLDAPVGLAGQVDDGDDRPLRASRPVGLDEVAHGSGPAPATRSGRPVPGGRGGTGCRDRARRRDSARVCVVADRTDGMIALGRGARSSARSQDRPRVAGGSRRCVDLRDNAASARDRRSRPTVARRSRGLGGAAGSRVARRDARTSRRSLRCRPGSATPAADRVAARRRAAGRRRRGRARRPGRSRIAARRRRPPRSGRGRWSRIRRLRPPVR